MLYPVIDKHEEKLLILDGLVLLEKDDDAAFVRNGGLELRAIVEAGLASGQPLRLDRHDYDMSVGARERA